MPTYEPLSSLVQLALAGIKGNDFGVVVDVNDLTQAPTGSTKKFALADLRTALLLGGALAGFATTDALNVQSATITGASVSINALSYHFPAAHVASGFLQNDGAGNLTWVTEAGGISLAGLDDVALAGLSNGQVLVYNSGTSKWNNSVTTAITSLGTQAANLLFVDATYDIGQPGATRPRHLYQSGNQIIGGTMTVAGAATFGASVTTTVTGGGIQSAIVQLRDISGTPTITSIPLLVKNYGFYVVGAGDTNGNDNNPGGIGILTFDMSSTSTRGSAVNFASSRSTATQYNAGTFTALQANDQIGALIFGGDNGVNLRNIGAQIVASAASTWSSTNSEGFLQFYTTPNASLTPTVRWQILSNGHFIAGADNTYDHGTSSTRARTGYFGTSIVIGTDPGGGNNLRVGGPAIFSAGTDAAVSVSVGAGGGAPTANRNTILAINGPSSGSFLGQQLVQFIQNGTVGWSIGQTFNTTTLYSSATSFGFFATSGTPVASLNTGGMFTTTLGHTTRGGGIGTFGTIDAFGVNFVVGNGVIAGFDTSFNFNFNGAPATGSVPAINLRTQSGNGTAFGFYMDQVNTGTSAGVGHKFALADSVSAMVTAGTIEFGKTNTWTSGSNATYMSRFVLKLLASNVLTTYLTMDGNTGISTFFSPVTISGQTVVSGSFTGTNVLNLAATMTTTGVGGRGLFLDPTIVSTANNETLTGASVSPAFTPGAFTGLVPTGLLIGTFSTAAFTTPADPISLSILPLTGTNATNAYSIKLGAGPSGATNNYLIHSTNFQLTAAGAGTFASTLAVTGAATLDSGGFGSSFGGTLKITGIAAIGTNPITGRALAIASSLTATGAVAIGLYNAPTLVAAANGDALRGSQINPTFTPGALTGLVVRGLLLSTISVAAFTSPADVAGIEISAITGTGAVNASALLLGAGPSGATNNYLVSATNFKLTSAGAIAQYNGVATAAWGTPAIYGQGRKTAQTAASGTIATYTVGAADGSFVVYANVLITAATTASFTVTCTYTDEGNTVRTLTLTFSQISGVFLTTITNVTGVGAYEGVPLYIRAKAGTAITIQTAAGGTYTSVTYNAEASIMQAA